MSAQTDRILERIEQEIKPLLDKDTYDDGYDCCGCSSPGDVLADVVAIVQEEA